MKGRKPTPTAVKVLRGNPGRRPVDITGEPRPDSSIPHCPAHLNDEAKREWRRMVKKLHEAGLFTYIDKAALAMYCQAWGRWVEAEEKLEKHGSIMKTKNGNLIQNPYLAVANRAMKQLKEMAAEFGMTPSARTRVKAIEPEYEQLSLVDALFKAVQENG